MRFFWTMKESMKHWMFQRITAILLIPLGLWFVVSFASLITVPYEEVLVWLASPVSATCAILFVLVLFYHGVLGMQVVFEDYTYEDSTRKRLSQAIQ